MNFEDSLFTEELRVSSGDKALDVLFRKYMKDIFSPNFLSKIDRQYDTTLNLRDFKEKSNVMAYTQGTKIYVNRPLFYATPKDKAMNYIMHELIHVLSNSGAFPELKATSTKLVGIVAKGVSKDKISDFFTGKHQNIHSDWHGETINYLCNNSINWEVGTAGIQEAYKEILEESGLFNMRSAWWQKRFPLTKKEK